MKVTVFSLIMFEITVCYLPSKKTTIEQLAEHIRELMNANELFANKCAISEKI